MSRTDDTMDELQELVWTLIDEQATESDIRRLETLLLADAEARRLYILCIQLHVDLCILLGGKRFALPPAILEAQQSALRLPPVGPSASATDGAPSNGAASR